MTMEQHKSEVFCAPIFKHFRWIILSKNRECYLITENAKTVIVPCLRIYSSRQHVFLALKLFIYMLRSIISKCHRCADVDARNRFLILHKIWSFIGTNGTSHMFYEFVLFFGMITNCINAGNSFYNA